MNEGYNPNFLLQLALIDLEKQPPAVRDGLLAEAERQKAFAEYRRKMDVAEVARAVTVEAESAA